MSRRFSKKKQLHIKPLYTCTVLFILFVALFMFGIRQMEKGNMNRQEESLRSAMERDIMHCYALEGFYPPSLEYIESHYGLTYDSSEFLVDYQPVGNNIYPNYTIINRRGKK